LSSSSPLGGTVKPCHPFKKASDPGEETNQFRKDASGWMKWKGDKSIDPPSLKKEGRKSRRNSQGSRLEEAVRESQGEITSYEGKYFRKGWVGQLQKKSPRRRQL